MPIAFSIDEALVHDGLDRRQDALQRALAGVAGRVDDVRHQHQVAVAHVVGDVDGVARRRPDERVHVLREPLVDVDHQRVLLRRVEVLRFIQRRFEWNAIGIAEMDQFARSPQHLFLLWIRVGYLFEGAERRIRDMNVRLVVESGGGDHDHVGVLGLAESAVILRAHQQLSGGRIETGQRVEPALAGLEILGAQQQRLREIDTAFLGFGVVIQPLHAELGTGLAADGQLTGGRPLRRYGPNIVAIVDQRPFAVFGPAGGAVGRGNVGMVVILVVHGEAKLRGQVGHPAFGHGDRPPLLVLKGEDVPAIGRQLHTPPPPPPTPRPPRPPPTVPRYSFNASFRAPVAVSTR